jgi:hypothetical protein
VQSLTDRSATNTNLTLASAVGGSTLQLASIANYARGDRIMLKEGNKVETASVTAVDATNSRIFITTGVVGAPTVGLKNPYTVSASVRALSVITLAADLTKTFPLGSSTIAAFSTVTLAAPLTLTHARDNSIRLTRTDAGNVEWSARIFKVDSTNAANNVLLVAKGATGGGWNSKVPSAPHADSRFITVLTNGTDKYLVELDDGGAYRMALANAAGDISAANRKWQSLNGNLTANLSGPNALALSEANSVAYDPLNDIYLIGTQDNASQQETSPDSLQWETLNRGDGNTQGVGIEQAGRHHGRANQSAPRIQSDGLARSSRWILVPEAGPLQQR